MERNRPRAARCRCARLSGAEEGKRVMLEVAPNVFNGIELRSIGGQALEPDAVLQRFDELENATAAEMALD